MQKSIRSLWQGYSPGKGCSDTEIYMCQERPDIMLEDRAAEAY